MEGLCNSNRTVLNEQNRLKHTCVEPEDFSPENIVRRKKKKTNNERYEQGKNWKTNPKEERPQKATHNMLKIKELKF